MHADGKSTLASVSKWSSVKVNFVFLVKQDAQLGIESVGHIGKDSKDNRSK